MTKREIDFHVAETERDLRVAVITEDKQSIFTIATPIIEFLSSFWLVPKKWRTVLKALLIIINISNDSR